MRSSALLIVMFLLAAILTTACVVRLAASPGPARFVPLALASVQAMCAAAAVVLMRRRLWLRLAILTAVLIAWPLWLPAADRAILSTGLAGIALLTAACCGAMRLVGWGPASSHAQTGPFHHRPGQFSLATLMLTTAVVAVYLGWLRMCFAGP